MANQADLPVRRLCKVLGVSPSGYYAWLDRPPSRHAIEDAVLTERIRLIHEKSRGNYGSPNIHAELQEEGVRVARKRVARLMRQGAMRGAGKAPVFVVTTRRDLEQRPAPDLVNRKFEANGPDQLWVADMTYVPTWAGFIYLAIVLDVWSRRIVGWAMSTSLATKVVLDAIDMAIRTRQPSGVIHHSDQGCQYTSYAFGQKCVTAGVRPSMGTVGDAYDNAMAESFFSVLEHELLARQALKTNRETELDVFTYIEGWYNPRRRHSALGYKSPAEFEESASLTPRVPSP